MIWCRFELEGETNFGIVEGDRVIQVSGSPLGEYAVTNNVHPLEQVKLLAPIKPAMLYADGPNYRRHAEAMAARRGSPPSYPDRRSRNNRPAHAVKGRDANTVLPKVLSPTQLSRVQPSG